MSTNESPQQRAERQVKQLNRALEGVCTAYLVLDALVEEANRADTATTLPIAAACREALEGVAERLEYELDTLSRRTGTDDGLMWEGTRGPSGWRRGAPVRPPFRSPDGSALAAPGRAPSWRDEQDEAAAERWGSIASHHPPAAPRFLVHVPVSFQGPAVAGSGTIQDISTSGARLRAAGAPPQPGATMTMRFSIFPGSLEISLSSEIVRHTEDGFAVRFLDLSYDQDQYLKAALPAAALAG
jgi:hypothetical protein